MSDALNFNDRMAELIGEVLRHVPEFRHFDARRFRVSASFNRSRSRGGVLAYIVPLRYRDGLPVELRRHGSKMYHWAMMPHEHEGNQILYFMYFMLPRYLNLTLRQKIETVVHELYHVHPSFNGDLRRFRGRSRLHGDSRAYDLKVRDLTDAFLGAQHDPTKYEFLRGTTDHLRRRYGEILAHHLAEPRPKLIKVTAVDETEFPPPLTY